MLAFLEGGHVTGRLTPQDTALLRGGQQERLGLTEFSSVPKMSSLREKWQVSPEPFLWSALMFLAACGFFLFVSSPAETATPPEDAIFFSKKRLFKIPFVLPRGKDGEQEVQLWLSWDKGQSWERIVTVKPEQSPISVKTKRDGLAWFTMRTIDKKGIAEPRDLGEMADIKVQIETDEPNLIESREFNLPVLFDAERKGDIKEVQLLQSWNQGKSWERIATVKPDQISIPVKTNRDGVVWFSLQIIKQNGMPDPVDPSTSVDLKVRIDTKAVPKKSKE
jgi:hypothetical protein